VSWLSIDEDIAELQSKIKVLKDKKKKEVEPEIMDFMKTYNISDLNTQNGRLKYSEKNVKKGLNKKSIMENLILYYNNNEDKAEEVTNFIYDNREEKTTQKITKLKAKKMPLNMST
jgi:hypothetical protein